MLKKPLLTVLVTLVGSFAGIGLLTPTQVLATPQGKVSKSVGDPLAAALAAVKKGEYQPALAKLKIAESVAGKSSFEQFQINETYGFVYLKQRNYQAAASAYERSLEGGQLPAAQVTDRMKQLAELNFQTPRNLSKVIKYSVAYLKATGRSDPTMHALLGQAYQLSGNDKAAIAEVQTAVGLSNQPNENWLLILLKSYGKLGNIKAVSETTQTLVKLYPTQENWRLLSGELRRQASGDDRTALNVYRLMHVLDLMDKPGIYNEPAIIAIQSGLPAEAVKIMERGYSRQIFTGSAQSRSQRILADARQKLALQQLTLTQLTQSAATSKAGQDEILVGEVLLSYGQADQAVSAAKRGLQKGGKPDDAYMLIGRAQLQLKNSGEARKAFSQIKGPDSGPVAKLWEIYARRV